MVDKPIDERRSHDLVAKIAPHSSKPFIGGRQRRRLLVAARHQLKEERRPIDCAASDCPKSATAPIDRHRFRAALPARGFESGPAMPWRSASPAGTASRGDGRKPAVAIAHGPLNASEGIMTMKKTKKPAGPDTTKPLPPRKAVQGGTKMVLSGQQCLVFYLG